jgi:5-hydroxydodecatetraenal polyketide synthase CpkA
MTTTLITGANKGLGLETARQLIAAGHTVYVGSRDAERGSAAVASLGSPRARLVQIDVTDDASVEAAAKAIEAEGGLDVLVNNAGIAGPAGPLWDSDPEEWSRTVDVNVIGAFELSRIVLRQMVVQGHGRIINITSNAAVYRWPLMSAYAASKAALVKLTETLAVETGRYGVAVLSFDPGLLPIGFTEPALASGAPAPAGAEGKVYAWIRERIAAGHGADPAQAARQLVRLAAGDGDRLTGRHLAVTDDLDAVLAKIDHPHRDDLHYLRLRTLAR